MWNHALVCSMIPVRSMCRRVRWISTVAEFLIACVSNLCIESYDGLPCILSKVVNVNPVLMSSCDRVDDMLVVDVTNHY